MFAYHIALIVEFVIYPLFFQHNNKKKKSTNYKLMKYFKF